MNPKFKNGEVVYVKDIYGDYSGFATVIGYIPAQEQKDYQYIVTTDTIIGLTYDYPAMVVPSYEVSSVKVNV